MPLLQVAEPPTSDRNGDQQQSDLHCPPTVPPDEDSRELASVEDHSRNRKHQDFVNNYQVSKSLNFSQGDQETREKNCRSRQEPAETTCTNYRDNILLVISNS